MNEQSGLLMENSYFRDVNNKATKFPNIDSIVAVRHLTYLYEGLADRPLPDRHGIFDFGTVEALPNVAFPTSWGRTVPAFIYDGFRAVDYRDGALKMFADYQPQDVVMWIGDRR